MIITKARPYKEIKAQLDKKKTIGLVSCNTCVRFCKTGGLEVMEKLKKRLEKDGYQVVDTDLIGTPCFFQTLAATQLRAEITIVLACEAGMANLRKAFPKKKLVSGLITVGLGAVDEKGGTTVVKEF
jgi:ferredoxin